MECLNCPLRAEWINIIIKWLERTYDTESNIDLFVNGRPNDNSFASDMGSGA